MKKYAFIHLLLLCPILSFTQVGIGTTSPSVNSILELNSDSKGLLLPRLTSAQRNAMNLTSDDEGMMIYQTSPAKGTYTFDGTSWYGFEGGALTGSTLCWNDSSKSWICATNLFNQGSSIGIGTIDPKTQLHIHSDTNATNTRIQFTNPATGDEQTDGLLTGITSGNGDAHILQQENKALWFGTNGSERMKIDSAGNIGINGSLKIGQHGAPLSGVLRSSVLIDLPNIAGNNSEYVNIDFPNAIQTATVFVSPGGELLSVIIAYAYVSSPGNVRIKFTNPFGIPVNEFALTFNITVIQ